MTRTRKILHGMLIAMSATFLACSDDILEKKPLNGFSEVDVFSDAGLLNNYVNGTYVGVRHPISNENNLSDGLTDNAFNRHGSAEGQIKVYTRGEISPDNGEGVTRGAWNNNYQYIRRINLFFEKIGESPLDDAVLAPLEGEMHFIRAFLYFDLLRWYGGVPLITKTYGLEEASYDVARNTVDEVVAFIVAECDLAMATLPAKSGTPAGKSSKEAAMALKARTLLYAASPLFNPSNAQAKWEAARDANKAVMDLGIPFIASKNEYGSMFGGKSSAEIIFARYFTQTNVQKDDGNKGEGVNLWLYSNGYGGWNTTTPTQDLVDQYELINGKLPADPTSGYDDQNPYVNRDPRFAQSILFNGATFRGRTYDYFIDKAAQTDRTKAGVDSRISLIAPHNASLTGYSFRKYTEEDKPANASGANENTNPFIYFRKSEFYLNYAEAQIALNQEAEARNAINAVRRRVEMPDVVESGAALVARYRRERRIELLLEEHRFFDMRRWLAGPEMLNKPALGVDVYKNGTTMEYIYGMVADNTRKWDNKMYLLPIPTAEVQRSNNKLVQNDGYIK